MCTQSAQALAGQVFLGESAAAERLRVQVRRIAPYYRTALLVGEAGTGKLEVALELHRLSPVGEGAFVRCDAAGLTDEAVDQARAGTIFITHLESLRADGQAELLARLDRLDQRLRARLADTRVIFAGECELRGMVAAGRMREDLARRVTVLELRVPPLRERMDDLPALLGPVHASEETLQQMLGYGWPGNLRELGALIMRCEGQVTPDDLKGLSGAVEEPAEFRLDAVLRRHVADVLERCAGNKLRTAEMLGISRSTLYRMLDSGVI